MAAISSVSTTPSHSSVSSTSPVRVERPLVTDWSYVSEIAISIFGYDHTKTFQIEQGMPINKFYHNVWDAFKHFFGDRHRHEEYRNSLFVENEGYFIHPSWMPLILSKIPFPNSYSKITLSETSKVYFIPSLLGKIQGLKQSKIPEELFFQTDVLNPGKIKACLLESKIFSPFEIISRIQSLFHQMTFWNGFGQMHFVGDMYALRPLLESDYPSIESFLFRVRKKLEKDKLENDKKVEKQQSSLLRLKKKISLSLFSSSKSKKKKAEQIKKVAKARTTNTLLEMISTSYDLMSSYLDIQALFRLAVTCNSMATSVSQLISNRCVKMDLNGVKVPSWEFLYQILNDRKDKFFKGKILDLLRLKNKSEIEIIEIIQIINLIQKACVNMDWQTLYSHGLNLESLIRPKEIVVPVPKSYPDSSDSDDDNIEDISVISWHDKCLRLFSTDIINNEIVWETIYQFINRTVINRTASFGITFKISDHSISLKMDATNTIVELCQKLEEELGFSHFVIHKLRSFKSTEKISNLFAVSSTGPLIITERWGHWRKRIDP